MFTSDEAQMSEAAKRVLKLATQSSLLIEVPKGRRERNRGVKIEGYQIHPMLAPRYHLPIGRRGAIGLTPIEANSIFDASKASTFRRLLNLRRARVTAPFGLPPEPTPPGQARFPDFG